MADFKIKDIIFSYRHVYIENLRRLNKKLSRHVSIDSKLINDITLYISNAEYKGGQIHVKYLFKKGSIGEALYDSNIDTFLKDNVVISMKQDRYESNSKGISIKDDKISKEIYYLLKEGFYANICGIYSNKDIRVSFTGVDITFSTKDFMVCYNCVGDIIYVYSPDPISIKDILNTSVDLEFDEYHNLYINNVTKILDTSHDIEGSIPGEYSIKEKDRAITLSRLKKNQLHKLI